MRNNKKIIATMLGLIVAAGSGGAVAAEEMDHSSHDMSGHDMSQHAGQDMAAAAHTHHGHGAGAWMLEYRFMTMSMDGLMDGTDELTTAEVTAMMGDYGYMMAPTAMTMNMHMIMGMYGITDTMTLMLMANYLDKEMDMEARDGTESSMSSSGLGDTTLGLMFKLNPNLVLSAGLSIPTGSIDEKGDMAMSAMMTMQDVQLPYGMQLGSGTYDLTPSVTWSDRWGAWGGGVQASYTWRSGENANEYTLGDRFELAFNGKYHINPNFIGSGRLIHSSWDNISGADPEIIQTGMMGPTSPAANPDAQGGSRTDFAIGVNGKFGSHVVGLEIAVPVAQDLDGPQMKTDRIISLGYQFMMM